MLFEFLHSKIHRATITDSNLNYVGSITIDEDFLEVIFTPFRKGIKGEFGLGLSIVKKSLQLLDYDISVTNVKNGVNFIIK